MKGKNMPTNYKNLFLKQSYMEALEEYERLLQRTDDHIHWDYVALTASSDEQAEAYRRQISVRLSKGRLPACTKYIVVSDPDGKRVGSGGATLNVLRNIAMDNAVNPKGKAVFEGIRILCIHSGGDSRRVPQYSACGKLFSPVPRLLPDGSSSTLFDEFMIGMCGVPKRMKDGMLVCSGDVLLLFDPLQLDYFSQGATAISVKTDAEMGCAHGVYRDDGCGNVGRFLHKQPLERLKAVGAVDNHGKVDIDTGAVILGSEILSRLYSLVDTEAKFYATVNDRVRLSFYADFSYPLSTEATLEKYMLETPEGEFTPELEATRRKIWEKLSGYSMRLTVFSPAAFLHFGTTRELLGLMTEDIGDYGYLGWSPLVNTNLTSAELNGKRVSVNCGFVSNDAVIHGDSYIEDSYINAGAEIGNGCIVSGAIIPCGVYVPDGTVVHGLALKEGKYTARVYGINDDPKKCEYRGKSIDKELWRYKLFPIRDSLESAVTAALESYISGEIPEGEELLSLHESFELVSDRTLIEYRDKLLLKIKTEIFLRGVDERVPVEKLRERVLRMRSSALDGELVRNIRSIVDSFDGADDAVILRKMRIYAYLSTLESAGSEDDLAACFDALREGMLSRCPMSKRLAFRAPVKEKSEACYPFRVNFGGGWTDTPPYCIENGGQVFNAAVTFGDELPIRANAEWIKEKKVVLLCIDTGLSRVLDCDSFGELFEIDKAEDPFLLHKVALIICGVLPRKTEGNAEKIAEDFFCKLGGGLILSTEARRIPAGSGLGTSSILAAACISAIYGLYGEKPSDEELWQMVLAMEQLMSTGGGWQDQIGGTTSGIKLISADPGMLQKARCECIELKKEVQEELEARFVLIYTGQRRLAKTLLRDVMGKYICSDEAVSKALSQLGTIPKRMKKALNDGDIELFAQLLNENLSLTVSFDCGCINDCIEEIFHAIDGLVCGKMICGAGGGGYIQAILKKGVSVDSLNARLYGVFGESEIIASNCRFR